jgi:hypothetical protein
MHAHCRGSYSTSSTASRSAFSNSKTGLPASKGLRTRSRIAPSPVETLPPDPDAKQPGSAKPSKTAQQTVTEPVVVRLPDILPTAVFQGDARIGRFCRGSSTGPRSRCTITGAKATFHWDDERMVSHKLRVHPDFVARFSPLRTEGKGSAGLVQMAQRNPVRTGAPETPISSTFHPSSVTVTRDY